ncbi:hypothetical protein niasHT_037966 [Heterodera trifolii]|uniref:Uncharacterized protein n=1 Tax=Heterodera trifolii TaxID=157864 RepID=A0ABD2HSX4_9BILA
MALERFQNLNLPNFYAGLAIDDNDFDQNLENMCFLHSRRTYGQCGGITSYRNAKPDRRYGDMALHYKRLRTGSVTIEIDKTCIVRIKYNRGQLRGNMNEWLF